MLCLFGPGACGDDSPSVQLPELPALSPSTKRDRSADAGPVSDAERRRQALRSMAACLRRTEARAHRTWERVGEDIDIETGKPKRRDVAPFVYTLDAPLRHCQTNASELELVDATTRGAYEAYVEATRELARPTAQLAEYYRAKAQERDAWARAAELVAQLDESYATWERAAAALTEPLAAARDEADAALLKLLAETEKGLRWHLVDVAARARALARCLRADAPDPTACERALSSFATARSALARLVEANPDEYAFVFWLDAFLRNAERFEEASAHAVDALSTPKRRGPGYGPRLRKEVRKAFANLEDTADNIRFDV